MLLIYFVTNSVIQAQERCFIIESFENNIPAFTSFEDEDLEPDLFEITSENTSNPYSVFALKIWGNSWKLENIAPLTLTENSVWQIDVFCENESDIQGLGLSDGENTLFYSFFGSEELNIEEWVPVYQGCRPQNVWHSFQLPVAADWFAWYEEWPTITEIVFVNDADDNSGTVYFDNLIDISDNLPVPPEVEISYSVIRQYRDNLGMRNVTIQFWAEISDPDSEKHVFSWAFGDGSTSTVQNPQHTFLIEDDHSYTVLLTVTDETFKSGFGSCEVEVDPGNSSFPITVNFVGDVMFARNMTGIINSVGLEGIVEPTLPYLGDAADISVANLECPFTTATSYHPTKSIVFKAFPDYISALDHMGIDVVTLANNHIWDYLDAGLLDTQNLLDSLGIIYTGAGMNSYEAYQPAFINHSGVNIAFLFSSDRTGQYNNAQPYLQAGFAKPGFAYMTPYYVDRQIAYIQNVADLIVVETHSGSEYSTAPGANYDFAELYPGWQEKDFDAEEDFSPRADIPHLWDIDIRHHFIDSGADIVICHHPHIIQGLEIYNGKLIAHSLGNYIFDLNYAETFPSMILTAEIDNEGFNKFFITPIFIDDYIPKKAEGDLGKNILEYLAMRSRELNTFLAIDRQNITAEVISDTLSMTSQIFNFNLTASLIDQDSCIVSPPLKLPGNGYLANVSEMQPHGNYQVRFGRELVWNGNFEDEGCSEWNVNSDYEWYDETVSHSGQRSLCLFRNESMGFQVITDLENRLKRPISSQISLHGYLRTSNAAEAKIELRYFENRTGGDPLTIASIGLVNGTSDWQYFFKDVAIDNDTHFLNLNAFLSPPAIGDAFAWFDDLGIIEWTAWENFNPNLNVWNPNNYRYLQIKGDEEITNLFIQGQEKSYSNPPVDFAGHEFPVTQLANLYQNYPNPFNPSTKICFDIISNNPEKTELVIYNIKGQRVKTLVKESLPAGKYEYFWNGENDAGKKVSSGIYLFTLKIANDETISRKCLLLK